ncbi:septation protein SepH [Actinoallomurus iriomotensis]|uniref:DUF3071 domain-containing protein n=1 Tax=Actinoallomurus iriomotensis TaxID=478107 RepID=A0A9W6RLF9_9ACTN|nr:septation protein SepH [Actinoallomurus iriomotensis]GLY78106.1 hypothetical protein Airi01_063730 [Actinoallomurus iriomotensis]
MQELRLVAVSEDGSYLVLATAGRGTRFTLPVDDRLRAAVRGHFSRLGQYEIEVESPLRPKEIQARIRAGETAEEIAETAGIPVERVRWFEGPVLQEREYMAQQAQRVTIRRQGESAPAPALGEIVEERLGKRGIDLEEVEWDSRKCEDSTWRVRLSFSYDGRPYAAEWAYDPRRRHISAVNEEAARLSSLELDDPVDDIVTPFVPRRAMKVVTEPVREAPPASAPAPREEPPPVEEPAFVREVPRQAIPRPEAPRPEVPRPEPEEPRETGLSRAPSQREAAPAREDTAPRETVPPSPQETQRETARETAPAKPQEEAPAQEAAPPRPRETGPAEPRESAAAAPQAPPAEEPAPAPAEPARPAAKREPAVRKPVPKPAEPKAAPQKPAARGPVQPKPTPPKPAPPKQPKPAEAPAAETEQPAAAAAAGGKATPPPAQEKRPARKKARGKRASVPSWDEIMFGARRPE